MHRKTVILLASWILSSVCVFFIGMNVGGKNAIEEVKSKFEAAYNGNVVSFFPRSSYAITKEYPAMDAEGKKKFMEENAEFSAAVDDGHVRISPLTKQYYYADNVGNNPVVLDNLKDFYLRLGQYSPTNPPSNVIMSFDEYGRPSHFDFTDEEWALRVKNARENLMYQIGLGVE
ncbi:MAG: hypothetical protein LBT59_16390 [Clostridiales bacterium]|nr:hypothetical protein [Clostridiales bacterium]